MKKTACIILAAGRGERMKSKLPKVLHSLCARPMLDYVQDLIGALNIKTSAIVLGHRHKELIKLIKPGIRIVIQKKLLGTADAVRTALPALKGFKGTLLILYGDTPLLKKETVKKLLEYHTQNKLDATLLTAELKNPSGYGRVMRDKYSSICAIKEEKEADDFQKDIKEVNTGIICFNKESLSASLKQIKANNRKKEYYLTDVIGVLYKRGGLIDSVKIQEIDEALGINSGLDLAVANNIMRKRINEGFMRQGVTIVDPGSTFIGFGAKIGQDTVIYPFTVIETDVKIGSGCLIGPFAHLREGTRLADDIVLGNFTEFTRAQVGAKTLAKHFCYIADSRVGKGANIGAGTVTANFDGKKKNLTLIKDGAFIGSDTVLVAPVRIGKRAVTGAGAVVTKNKHVADGETVVGIPARPLKIKR